MLSIYKASAGSGKTFTLAYEYIKMLLGVKDESGIYHLYSGKRHEKHRSILAITFTNKATDEMKRRILHELAVLAEMEPGWDTKSDYMDRLCKELHATQPQIKTAAANALKGLLMDFNFFNISTIDAFFQVVLRTFAREAELTGNYELELDDEKAIDYGVNEMFGWLNEEDSSGETTRIINWITYYLIDKLHKGKSVSLFNRSARIHEDFIKLIKNLSNDTLTLHYDKMMEYLHTEPSKLDLFTRALSNAIEELTSISLQHCTRAIEAIALYCGEKDVKKPLINAFNKFITSPSDYITRPSTMMPKVAADIDNAYNEAFKKNRLKNPTHQLDSTIQSACENIENNVPLINLYNTIRENLFVLGLLNKVYDFVEQFRDENNTILLSDTNALLKTIIGEDDAPFVYERVGLWLKHFLIDEFQDTSRIQWHNIRPLLSESLGDESDSLIIGDEKQCIYRFRDSDPTLLQQQVPQDFAGRSQLTGNTPAGNTNWRSSKEIVEFNNELFAFLSTLTGTNAIYANVQQNLPQHSIDYHGYISVTPITLTADDFDNEAFKRMAFEMERQLRAGFKYSDICVLVRKNKDGAKVVDFLLNLISGKIDIDVPLLKKAHVVSDDAMYINIAPAVRMIISTLRDMNIPADSPNIPEESPTDTNSKFRKRTQLLKLLNQYEHLAGQGLPPDEALQNALDIVDNNRSQPDSISENSVFNLLSLVEYIINHNIAPEERNSQAIFISAFQDIVCDYCATNTPDVVSFLRWWDKNGSKFTVSAPMDSQAIRVMTIHKSKGLEFSCVHIPKLNYKTISFMGHQWFSKQPLPAIDEDIVPELIPLTPTSKLKGTPFETEYLQKEHELLLDELNLLYVAFTRAKEELIVSYAPSDKESDVGYLIETAANALPQYACAAGLEYGTPLTSPFKQKVKKLTVLDTHRTIQMPELRTFNGQSIWNNTRIDYDPQRASAIKRGTAMHNVLAMVTDTDSLHNAVRKAEHSHLITSQEAPQIETQLKERISYPNVRQWFSGYKRILCERPIGLGNGSTERPDRIVWTADGHVDIIDYKFGKERPKEYNEQVRSYMRHLTDMGYDNVRGYIWYVDTGIVRHVSL